MPYRIDPSRATYREVRTEASPVLAAISWALLKLRLPIASSSDHPTVDDLEPHRVHSTEIPSDVHAELDEAKPRLESLGFRGTVYHHVLDTRHQTELYFASYLHKSGKVIARITRRVFSGNTPPKKYCFTTFVTPLSQGRTLATSNNKGDLEGPEACLDEALGEVKTEEAWRHHIDRMKEPTVRESIQTVGDGRELLKVLQTRHQAITDHFVQRGLFVPVEEPLETAPIDPPADESAGGADPLLVAEVRKIEGKQPAGWTTSLLVLVGTVALFLAFGGAVWSWRFTLLLIPVLLVHEAGHYLAMKLFDYRNVRMFFIPLFGAAVTGRHYDVPGWKRVVTSLMGPVPGILIGVGMGIVAMVQQQELLMEAAALTLILNGFNLIPALPLDGGWVLHGLLFSRHAFLDLLSRLLAIGLLFFFAFAGGADLMMFLGIAMVMGLPMAFHMARITDRLRASGDPLSPPIEGHAPASAVSRIAAEIDKAYPKGLDVRSKAKLTLTTYENVNSRPPGIVATLALGFVYVASLLTACVAGVVFALAQNSDLSRLMADAAFGPQVVVSSDGLATIPPGLDATTTAWEEALVASFETATPAQAQFEALSADGAAPGAVVRYGGSLLFELPPALEGPARDALFDRLEAATPNLFLLNGKAGVTVEWNAVAATKDDAERIAEAVAQHTAIAAELLPFPPWSDSHALSAAEQTARRTVVLLNSGEWAADVEVPEDFYERVAAAERRGQDQAVKQLYDELRVTYERARDAFLQSLRDRDAGEIDLAVVEAYELALATIEDAPGPQKDEQQDDVDSGFDYYPAAPEPLDWMTPVAARFGCAPSNTQPPIDASHGYGFAEANGLFVSFTLDFPRVAAGPVRVLAWLESQGCRQIKCRMSKSWFEGILD